MSERCLICDKETKTLHGLGKHLVLHNLTTKQYYDKFLKQQGEGLCRKCGNLTNFLSLRKGYFKYCSHKCLANSEETQTKRKDTSLIRYGTEHPNQSNVIREKIKNTLLKNRENPEIVEAIKNKFESTNIKKYGVRNPSQAESIKQKKKDTCMQNYGVENPSQNQAIRQRKKETWFKLYGAEHPLKNADVRAKIKSTCMQNYGVENPSQSKLVKQKVKHTRLKNWLPVLEKILFNLDLELVGDYLNNIRDVEFKCKKCNFLFKTKYFYLQQGGTKCPNCYPKYKSIAETEILNFIKSLNFKPLENDRNIIIPLELDIYYFELRKPKVVEDTLGC